MNTKKKLKKKDFTSHIITGHTVPPKLKENIRDIMLYDIPGSWDAEQITEAIYKYLGSLLKATLKKQGKYYCVRAQVVLRTRILADFELQRWQIPLGGIKVRWFPGDWTLSMRKERQFHQAVINNLTDDVTEEDLVASGNFLMLHQAQSFKIIKNSKDKKKSKGTSLSEKKDKKKQNKHTSSKQDSVVDILVKALAQLTGGKKSLSQEKEKIRSVVVVGQSDGYRRDLV
ncbi:hypothetical protein C1645_830468 [Glomus cerebriforme]|uniref:Uncharacterized protein n=1 Tax=Glomus cerebriforme TaxID=658196 RepID=A0A397SHE1_9GLOM|nr:hypothetical protein C1645_830468 [Glomus cerebriforme]